jgi:hypothetical protein
MRGYQAPSKRPITNETQKRFASLSRGRRAKLAKAAGTTLIKADQWARGGAAAPEVATALSAQLAKLKSPQSGGAEKKPTATASS